MVDPTQVDIDTQIAGDGRHASQVRGLVEPFISQIAQALTLELISLHKADALTEAKMRGSVGEIAGLYKLTEVLDTQIREGEQAARRLNDG